MSYQGLIFAIVFTPAAIAAFADDIEPAETPDEPRPAQAAIRTLAKATRVTVLNAEGATLHNAELASVPLVKYGDETRNIKDSALWVWTDQQRPVMFQKIEVNDWNPGHPLWTFCVASLAEHDLKVAWSGSAGSRSSEMSANTYKELPGAPAAAAAEAAWSLQARQLARRFEVESWSGNRRSELRQLSKPLMEYYPQDSRTRYGAITAFATGTNPDVLVDLRLNEDAEGELIWSYSVGQMTSGRIVIRFDDEIVHEGETQKSSQISNWGYFFTARDPAIK